ncbi:HAMP domain-containing sensor histidine kinase [Sphingomonas sp. HF-S3]|uniref:histidine kinase n=1 Tax=Sphingomonas rustica TaxID=3103142 RepID=A0ABV0BAN6_9SPHN
MRLMPGSIRGRMLALSAVATLVALLVAGFLIAAVLGRVVTQGVDRRLDAQIALLATAVGDDGSIDRTRLDGLRGALEAGPGWRWQIVTPDRTLGSADFPALELGPPGPHGERGDRGGPPRPREGSEADGTPVHARQVTLSTPAGAVTLSASAPNSVIQRPIREAAVPLLGLLALLSLLLAAAALVQIRYGLRPLRALRDAVADIRAGRMRAVPEDQPAELQPLAQELNALGRDNQAALETARASAANLAHALKTPVATLAIELRDHPEHARQVERIDATIRHHLSRARERVTDRHARVLVAPAVADLARTVSRLNAGPPVDIATTVAPSLAVAVDPADFDEIVGNLLENAVRHAEGKVAVTAARIGAEVSIAVTDDGPGIAPDQMARAIQPGVRLDERGEGHGFGLAIARELSELYRGGLTLARAEGGGLMATVRLPIAAERDE